MVYDGGSAKSAGGESEQVSVRMECTNYRYTLKEHDKKTEIPKNECKDTPGEERVVLCIHSRINRFNLLLFSAVIALPFYTKICDLTWEI